MKRVLIQLLAIFFATVFFVEAAERGSSAPFISGDSFRFHCKFVYDELDKSMKPRRVKAGDSVFVKTDYLEEFFTTIHPKIKEPYVLVTHNSDHHIPGSFSGYLDDPKILAWFGQNVDNCIHPKLHAIPIGVANKCWGHGNVELIDQMVQIKDNFERKNLIYMNFSIGTYVDERSKVYNMFKDDPLCYVSPPKNYRDYLMDLAKTKFVLSPRGNGIDCHRTWEALLMGAIPIVKTSSLDPLFEKLPVLIIKDWDEVNDEMLEKTYEQLSLQNYDMGRAYVQYWLNLIDSYRRY